MEMLRLEPGPAAAQAFRLGMYVGGVVGLVVIGLLYWSGSIGLAMASYGLLVLFPVYLVFVAVALSRWLGYDRDITSLRPVTRTDDPR
ncbi:MAG: hypothetical protein V5A31_06715 [Haloferacaceae archaeon]|jgi:hypothetical protein